MRPPTCRTGSSRRSAPISPRPCSRTASRTALPTEFGDIGVDLPKEAEEVLSARVERQVSDVELGAAACRTSPLSTWQVPCNLMRYCHNVWRSEESGYDARVNRGTWFSPPPPDGRGGGSRGRSSLEGGGSRRGGDPPPRGGEPRRGERERPRAKSAPVYLEARLLSHVCRQGYALHYAGSTIGRTRPPHHGPRRRQP